MEFVSRGVAFEFVQPRLAPEKVQPLTFHFFSEDGRKEWKWFHGLAAKRFENSPKRKVPEL
jgi:hypothetical protein